MAKKKGGILSLIPLVISLILSTGGLFWLIVALIVMLCGIEINPILWIIGGSALIVGVIAFVILLVISKKKSD